MIDEQHPGLPDHVLRRPIAAGPPPAPSMSIEDGARCAAVSSTIARALWTGRASPGRERDVLDPPSATDVPSRTARARPRPGAGVGAPRPEPRGRHQGRGRQAAAMPLPAADRPPWRRPPGTHRRTASRRPPRTQPENVERLVMASSPAACPAVAAARRRGWPGPRRGPRSLVYWPWPDLLRQHLGQLVAHHHRLGVGPLDGIGVGEEADLLVRRQHVEPLLHDLADGAGEEVVPPVAGQGEVGQLAAQRAQRLVGVPAGHEARGIAPSDAGRPCRPGGRSSAAARGWPSRAAAARPRS